MTNTEPTLEYKRNYLLGYNLEKPPFKSKNSKGKVIAQRSNQALIEQAYRQGFQTRINLDYAEIQDRINKINRYAPIPLIVNGMRPTVEGK